MNHAHFLPTVQHPMYNGGGRGSWGMDMMYSPFGGWFMLLLLAVAIAAAFMIFRGRSRNDASGSGPVHRSETPLEILKRRYAAGEIDKEQFEAMKRDLSD
jgi:putative membrane protein